MNTQSVLPSGGSPVRAQKVTLDLAQLIPHNVESSRCGGSTYDKLFDPELLVKCDPDPPSSHNEKLMLGSVQKSYQGGMDLLEQITMARLPFLPGPPLGCKLHPNTAALNRYCESSPVNMSDICCIYM